ncbi:MAG: endonuclease, partial [Coprobacillus sp.]|nr:endonuclease [Coprobacillus sp.]
PSPDDPSQGGDDDNPSPDDPSQGGDDDNPSPDDPGGGTNPDPDPENPDEGDDDDKKGDESSEPIKHEYTYSASTTELNANGGSFTYNGLTWTFSEAVALSKDNNNRGVQIGTSKNAQSTPWTFSTDFGEVVLLESVSARIYTSTSSGLTAHYELTLDSTSLGSSDFHSNNSSDVYVAEGEGLPLYGQVLTLSINAVNETAFYFESISLVYYTNVDSSTGGTGDTGDTGGNTGDTGDTGGSTGGDTGGNTGDTETPSEEETSEYTYYQGYSHKFTNGELSTSGGSFTINGLTWKYDSFTYAESNNDNRGVQIGSSSNAQTAAWTISTDFGGETVKLTQATVYLFTGSGGSAKYTLTFDSNTLATGSFANSSNATSLDEATIVECSDLEYIGNTFSLTLQATSKAMFLYGISLSVMTKSDTSLNLSEETLVGDDYVAEAIVPGENEVLSTKYTSLDAESYYSTYEIDWTKTGDDLRTNLRSVSTPQTTHTYGDIRYMLPYSDEDPENPGYMYGLYDGDKIPAYWEGQNSNREHVWPCAHMKIGSKDRPDNSDKGHYSDLHNLRICCALTNEYKADKYLADTDSSLNFYANQSDPSSLGSHPFSEGNTEGDHRGDVARICLYMYVVYDGLKLEDGITSSSNDVTYGQLNTLLKWNYEDEPDAFEIQRNNRIYEYQGNRNPFIDYPELADYLFPNLTSYFPN